VSGLVVIAAGGTGGHFFPAEALASELAARGRDFVLMSDTRSAGLTSAVFEGRPRFVLPGMGVFGRGPLHAARALLTLLGGALKARAILAKLAPSVVVAFGGYPSFAPVVGARLLLKRPRILLHDQNAVLGRANRLLARLSDTLLLSHPHARHVPAGVATIMTGNPVRPAIASLSGRGYTPPTDTVNLLVLGGSLGARVFSDIVPPAVALLPTELQARLHITQQCRPEDLASVRTQYDALGIAAELASFFIDMADLLAKAHLVIARSGATTVAELAVAGRPSILVPLPIAIDDDQTFNAKTLAEPGGAWIMPQRDLTPAALSAFLAELLTHPDRLQTAAKAAADCGIADAASRIADLLEQPA
jgi:UDP-N-acetylglucosamine--N-acetylmuramyl-(pentapeptide) pyrophosphoryl-undecaprenol N-acetylglucosamine transferase